MNPLIEEFWDGVYEQAVSRGHSPYDAERIAALAVLNRLERSEAGFAVAQTTDFVPQKVYCFELEAKNYRVDQAEGGGVVVEAVLTSTVRDVEGQRFSVEALHEFARQINERGVGAYLDGHKQFRLVKDRLSSNSVTEWVKARVDNELLIITAKLKRGFEWVADRFNAVSIETIVPGDKALFDGSTRTFTGGFVKGFVFTNTPKNPVHKILSKKAVSA